MKQKRIPTKLRPIKIQTNYLPHAEGSCLFSMGKTQVLCVATVENRVPPFLQGTGLGWVTAEYNLLPRAGEQRTPRSRGSGRSQEIQRMIGRSLRAVFKRELLGERTILIDCDVIRADGGTRTAAVNGAFLALCGAVQFLMRKKVIEVNPVQDYLAAVSVGIIEGKIWLDIDYALDSNAAVDLNMVLTGRGKIVEIQGTAEKEPFSFPELSRLLEVARKGIKQIIAIEKKALSLSRQ